MSGRVRWTRGGAARIESVVGDAIVLRLTVPWPPGSRIEGTLEDAPVVAVRVKVHGSRKGADGQFEIHGRLMDASREVRERMARAVGADGT